MICVNSGALSVFSCGDLSRLEFPLSAVNSISINLLYAASTVPLFSTGLSSAMLSLQVIATLLELNSGKEKFYGIYFNNIPNNYAVALEFCHKPLDLSSQNSFGRFESSHNSHFHWSR